MDKIDQLQLIEPTIIQHVAGLDADGMWQLTLERLEDLKRLEKFHSPALYALPYGMEHFENKFWMFYDEDPDCVMWGLFCDLGFLGKPLRISPWAASGYLDHGSSADVVTSRELLPDWDEEEDGSYFSFEFDVLDASHVELIAGSLDNHRNLGLEDDIAARLQVRTMAKAIRNDPTLRAAYIYKT